MFLACFQHYSDVTLIKGLLKKEKKSQKGVVEYFGDFGEDTDACEDACRNAKWCTAFTHEVEVAHPDDILKLFAEF